VSESGKQSCRENSYFLRKIWAFRGEIGKKLEKIGVKFQFPVQPVPLQVSAEELFNYNSIL
jgi:hypothetical protein